MISLEEVFEAYYECRRNKRRPANALLFESDYESNLVKLHHEINTMTYEIGKSITFIVTRPVKREVFAADFRDRIVHHLIARRLEPLFESVFIDDNYNCRKGKGVLYGVKRLREQTRECSENYTRECYIMKNDIQGFFMSIYKPLLWKMLEKFILEKYKGDDIDLLLYLTKKVVLHNPELNCIRRSPLWMWNDVPKNKSLFTNGKDYGLPIGNLTSQIFANFYLHDFDLRMKERFGYYGRYVDDFYTISRDKQALLDITPVIRKELKDERGLTLHPKKLYLQRYEKGCKFTGSVVKGDRMYIGNQTVANMINSIRKFNETMEPEKFISSMNSYLGFLSHYSSYAIKRKIVKIINPKLYNFFYISGRFEKLVYYDKNNRTKRKLQTF